MIPISDLTRIEELVLLRLVIQPSAVIDLNRSFIESAAQLNMEWNYTTSAVNNALIRLRKKGYVQREEDLNDGRRVLYYITTQGIVWLKADRQFRRALTNSLPTQAIQTKEVS